MEVLPLGVTGDWITSEFDSTVRYRLAPLTLARECWVASAGDPVKMVSRAFRSVIGEIEGLTEGGEPFKPIFDIVDQDGIKFGVFSKGSTERIHKSLINEITQKANELHGPKAKEAARSEVDFSQDSPQEPEDTAEIATEIIPNV